MSKKSKTTTTNTEQTHLTQTPTNPAWVDSGLQGVGSMLANLQGVDPGSLVAGPDPLQTQAANAAGNLTSSPYFSQAGDIFGRVANMGANTYNPATGTAKTYNPATGTASLVGDTPQVQAASLLDNLGAYMSPYTNDVVNTTLQGYDQSAGYSRAGDALARAGDTTFGGSGGAIQTALNEQNIRQNRSQLEAGLRDQAFNTGANLSNLDAGRRQSASSENAASALQRALANQSAQNTYGLANMDALNQAGQFNAGAENTFGLANMGALNDAGRYNAAANDTAAARQLSAGSALGSLGQAQGADARANIGLQSDIGSILQQISQNKATAPLTLAGTLASIYGGLPLNLLHGNTADGTSNSTGTSNSSVSDPMGALSGILSAGGSLASGLGSLGLKFSDRRLKRDVVKIGQRPDGLGVYLYRYLWSPLQHVGVMAQEVLKVKPEAVVTTASGFYAVDYGKL